MVGSYSGHRIILATLNCHVFMAKKRRPVEAQTQVSDKEYARMRKGEERN
jgi:hypothetical protein